MVGVSHAPAGRLPAAVDVGALPATRGERRSSEVSDEDEEDDDRMTRAGPEPGGVAGGPGRGGALGGGALGAAVSLRNCERCADCPRRRAWRGATEAAQLEAPLLLELLPEVLPSRLAGSPGALSGPAGCR